MEQVILYDGLLDLKGAAEYLNVTTRFLRGVCKSGQITYVKLGQKHFRFRREELEAYLYRRTRKTKAVHA